VPSVLGATHGGWVHMVNVTTRDGFDRSTSGWLSSWAKNHLGEAALGAGVGLTAAIAIFCYALRKQLRSPRSAGRRLRGAVAVRHELAVTNLVAGPRCERYRGLTVTGADAVRPNEHAEMTGVPVYGELNDGTALRNDKLRTSRASPACGRSTAGRT
jgi:hypothetical protein